MGMSARDQAETAGGFGGNWRMLLKDMRTVDALRAEAPENDAIARLSDRVLRAATHNPDHSEAGRAAAREALRARGIDTAPWRMRVPGFITARDLERRGEHLFFGWGRAVRVWSGWALFAILAGVFAAAALSPDRAPMTTETRFWIDVFGTRLDSDILFSVLGLSVLALIAIWLIASAFRRKPARVLLLRKFNERSLSAPLERMLAKELRPYGHVASLSDKHIKRDAFGWLSMASLSLTNPIAALWFVIGAPVRFVYRLFDRSAMGPAFVLNARDYRNFARRLRDRIGLNIQVAMTSKEAFLVRTSDAWWKMVVQLLLDSSDAIVVDISQVTEGTAWELDVIAAQNAAPRCVFVSVWGKADEARAELARRGLANQCFHYAPDGEMQNRAVFRAAMLSAMRATHGLSP
jgi:nucleoside 2-deoxyribosyltransferase